MANETAAERRKRIADELADLERNPDAPKRKRIGVHEGKDPWGTVPKGAEHLMEMKPAQRGHEHRSPVCAPGGLPGTE